MSNQRDDRLYAVAKWQKTEKKTGVILHLSSYDREKNEWHNARVYVPFAINVAEDKREKTTIAKFAKDDAAGARGCWVHIPVEFVPKPKDTRETDDPYGEFSRKSVEKPKTAETLQDGDIPF